MTAPDPSSKSTDLHRNTLLVGAANLLSRMTGLLREVAFAATFGAGIQADAFNAAFRVGNLFRELFAEGALSNAFVPLFADVAERDGENQGWALANAFLGLLLAAVGAVTLLTLLAARPLVYMLAAGFAEDPSKFDLAVSLTRVLSPFVATVSVASVFMGMLNVRGRFFLPTVVPVVFNGFVIAACLGAEPFREATGLDPIYAVALAALLGGACQAALQLPTLRRLGFRLRPNFRGHPALRRLIAFLIPALIAISVVQINLLIETQLASREGDGPVSWLIYSFRIAHLPFSIVSGAVAVASLAGLSVLIAQDRKDEFRKTLGEALNLNSFLVAPAALGLIFVAEPVVRLLFERGAFTPADTLATAAMLRMYGFALLGIGAQRVLVPVFYTLNDPRTPMWVGLGTVALKLPVALALMYPLGFGVNGLPLSHAVLVTAEVALLVWILNRRVAGLWGLLLGQHARMVVALAVMGAAMSWLGPRADGLMLFPVIVAGAAVYFVAADLVGLRQSRTVLARFLRRRPKGLPPTVDADTQAALALLDRDGWAAPRVEGSELAISTASGTVRVSVLDGSLIARLEPGPGPTEPLDRSPVLAVMRVGAGPPRLAGLVIGESAWRADGDAVVAGLAQGPRISVSSG